MAFTILIKVLATSVKLAFSVTAMQRVVAAAS
jgi:hypothetical protein